MRAYFGAWVKKTFVGSWGLAMLTASVLGLVVSFAADRYPTWAPLANRAAWQLPVALFILTLIPAAMHASWTLYSDVLERMVKALEEAEGLREQLADRLNYRQMAETLSRLHREASEGWINLVPSNDQILAEKWRPLAQPWLAKATQVLKAFGVPHSDLAHFEVVNVLDLQAFSPSIPEEIRRAWIRVARLGELARKYEGWAQQPRS